MKILLLLLLTLPLFGEQITLFGKVSAPEKPPEILKTFPPLKLLFNLTGNFKSFECLGTPNQLFLKIEDPALALTSGLIKPGKTVQFKTFKLHPAGDHFYLYHGKNSIMIGSLPLLKKVLASQSLTFHSDLTEIIKRYKLTDNFIAMVAPKNQKKLLKQLPIKSISNLPPAKFTIENSAALLFTFKHLPKKTELKIILRGEEKTIQWFAQFFKQNLKHYAPIMDQKLNKIEAQTALLGLLSQELDGPVKQINEISNGLKIAYHNLRFKIEQEDLQIITSLPKKSGELIPQALLLFSVMNLKQKHK